MEKPGYRNILADITEKVGKGQLLTLNGASEYLGVEARQLRLDKTFPLKKIGGRYYVAVCELARWLSA